MSKLSLTQNQKLLLNGSIGSLTAFGIIFYTSIFSGNSTVFVWLNYFFIFAAIFAGLIMRNWGLLLGGIFAWVIGYFNLFFRVINFVYPNLLKSEGIGFVFLVALPLLKLFLLLAAIIFSYVVLSGIANGRDKWFNYIRINNIILLISTIILFLGHIPFSPMFFPPLGLLLVPAIEIIFNNIIFLCTTILIAYSCYLLKRAE